MTRVDKPLVLVVDDEPSVLITYRLILEQQGYRVSAALTSTEALRVVREDNVDLLLCDLSLEQQHSGFEVIDAAREKNPNVPVVLLTGYASKDATESARRNKIRVLFKPIDIQEFLGTISESLGKDYEQSKVGDD